ncbi:hypothetical protein [Gallibacter sp. Marseille-QA0791]|uniref:hypothetical protein n=1 Tax=Gallibacter sp. Marseille-QA0791 TaxID=3378781 RepID=UPI003D0F01A6
MSTGIYIAIISIIISVLIPTLFRIIKHETKLAKVICVLCVIAGIIATMYYLKDDITDGPEKGTTESSERTTETSSERTDEIEYEEVSLFSLDTYYQNTDFIVVDNYYQKANTGELFGEVMSYRYNWAIDDDITSVQEYKLDKKYVSFSGTLFLPFESRSVTEPDYPSVFKIYGDEDLLYEAPNFISGQDPVEFEKDLSGYETLKILMGGGWYKGDGSGLKPLICLANPILVREVTHDED